MKLKLVPVLLLVILLLTGCGTRQAEISSLEDMKDMSLTVGLSDDIDGKAYILDVCPKAQIVSQNDVLYGVRSVSEGKIDAYAAGRIYLDTAMREGSINNVRVLDEPLHIYQCALGLSTLCDIPDYENTVNETLKRFISDGVIEEMHRRWFDEGCEALPDIRLDNDPAYILNAFTFGQCKPYSYFSNGELVGFDVELIYRMCAENHWGLELSHAEYPGMLMGLSTGKFDMISANLYVTDNREGNIAFSVPYNTEDISILVRDNSASGKEGGRKLEYSTLEELDGAKVFGVSIGTVADTFVRQRYPDAEIQYYPTAVDASLALANGKADAVVFDAPTLKYIESSTAGVGLMDEVLANDDYHFIIRKSAEGEALKKDFNEWLGELRESGELEKLRDFWCGNEEPAEAFDFASLPAVNGTLKIATDVVSRPDVYSYGGGLAGYPTELIYNFCRDRGYGAEVSVISFDAMVPALVSGKADVMMGFVSYTEERAQNVLYTDCILEGGVGVLVRSADSAKSGSFLDTFRTGLHRTFVAEGRWRLIVSGLGVTFIITAGGFLLANILGALFCACIMSRRRGLQILADVYDRIMQGTPIVVVLMILYYVIFGKSHISGVLVAVFGFGLASGASLARQFYGAISAVDRGQTEAALALGFTKLEAFTGIVLPQATRTVLPGYFSEIIALMKGTAIVGYIAVTDLTKASDLIRSSTYDAFFPLFSVAIIYFLIAFGILSLLKFFQRRLAPKRVTSKEAET